MQPHWSFLGIECIEGPRFLSLRAEGPRVRIDWGVDELQQVGVHADPDHTGGLWLPRTLLVSALVFPACTLLGPSREWVFFFF